MRLWRCITCGKWSHAQRRPRGHERWVPSGETLEPGAKVVREVPPTYGMEGPEDEGGRFIACGPFHGWTATPDPEQLTLPMTRTTT